ncbi:MULTISPECIES: isoaspartyl peptidase/L-asparaginase family protein [Flammeovirga]|uniref:N(4)-(Beta-N-acetylglucosaminyl)-L-asparaginase n=1 Tax=Flammeovirga aprica JL-4 TaxID=694437 RepID=A0A7X9RYB6_9BACT|nr:MULTISPECIES: N(4)-(beta-N-acetylglucosaminyl)-L-asparaginase [Flammeovirga]KXX67286.1 glycosylasparaginase [Flammeovirga sp. SJP92]NME70924.1 N(4)-(beta-N-acetylglucosaminyl)-L-asparaginase [Flammeovirga aprica JL-4]
MGSRRDFLRISALSSAALITPSLSTFSFAGKRKGNKPLMISTWNHGFGANEAGWEILKDGGAALDAVEAGVRVPEADPKERSVGYGGLPDRDGKVTLDACIMNHEYECGAVAALENIMHPISVARLVMEKTPHAMLVGEGAQTFALAEGFKEENLLTERSKKDWEEWLKKSEYKPVINIENHDTIGALAIDAKGHIAGACTTSGAAYKMHGRVGDSPLIGAGLFVDGEIGAACATGLGEAVIRTAGSAMVVEHMRMGKSPVEACEIAVKRIMDTHKSRMENLQVGFLAINKNGEYGGYSIRNGFNYAIVDTENGNRMEDAQFKMKW